jgi:hypothetical protein
VLPLRVPVLPDVLLAVHNTVEPGPELYPDGTVYELVLLHTASVVVEPAVAEVAGYALIVKVLVAGAQPATFETVMVSVTVAPLAISLELNVYVGV